MPLPTYGEPELTAIIADVVGFVRASRDHFREYGVALDAQQRKTMRPFFSAEVLDGTRIVLAGGGRLQNPDFYYRARERGFGHMPDFSHLGEVTFDDTILFQAEVTGRLLFHALVHGVQYRLLGVEQYVDLYLRSFVKNGLHIVVPFEVQAYALDQRFAEAPARAFSVEAEVRRWLDEGRYRS